MQKSVCNVYKQFKSNNNTNMQLNKSIITNICTLPGGEGGGPS